jgi:SAM-dependent methyltransferase
MSSESNAVRQIPVLHGRFWSRQMAGIARSSETRVLEVGCGRGESLALLHSKKIDAYGFDLGAAAQLLVPKDHYAFGSLSSAMTFPQHHFDLVVVRPIAAFRGELSTPEHYVATANLLSCVKPGGKLVIVEPSQGRDGVAAQEWLDRWQTQLGAFTAERSVRNYRDGLGWWLSLGFLSSAPRLDLRTIVLTSPAQPVPRLEWHRQARAAVMPKSKTGRRAA